MNDQQQSRADALTDDQRQALGESISEYFGKLDSDEGIRAPEGRILRAFDYCDSRNVDDLIDRAIVPALSISANETGAEGAKPIAWFIDWPDEPELGHYFAEEPCDPKYGRSRALGFIESRSPAMAAAATADERAKLERLRNGLENCIENAQLRNDAYDVGYMTEMLNSLKEVIARAAASPAAEAVAWVRKHPDTGELSGDWLWNDAIEQCRKDSGVWFPLGFLGARPALPEEPAAIHQVIHQVWVEETSSWADVTPAYYAERQPSNRRRVYYAPQPAQADAPAHATECPHCDGEGVIEADGGASPCACAQDAQEGMPTFGARRTQADAPAEAREPNQIYVEVRQCDRCDHIGINDGHATDAACGYPCGWSGPSPVEDKCPGCGHENVMSVACPKCSGHYSLLANGLFETNEVSELAEAREPIAWVTDDDRAITAAQKQRALADGGATASSVRPYSIPCYAVSAPADAGEAREPIGPHDLSTTAGGRSYVAEFFAKRLRRHDFGRYITGQLAADFACSRAAYLRDHDHAAADAGEAQPYACVAPVSNYATRNKIVADRIGGLIPVYTAQPAARVASLTDAARDMLAERRRQVEAEGWTPKHDDEHDKGEMARAAACYALHAGSCFAWRADAYQSAKPHEGNPAAQNSLWPWDMKWWKPKDPRRDLVRAGALILAELERLDRATLLNGADKS